MLKIPLPLGNINLVMVDVDKTEKAEETGFCLLFWLHSSLSRNNFFLDQISKPHGSDRYESTAYIISKWSGTVRDQLKKHLYKPIPLQTEKRLTRSTQNYDTTSKLNRTLSKINQNPNLSPKSALNYLVCVVFLCC